VGTMDCHVLSCLSLEHFQRFDALPRIMVFTDSGFDLEEIAHDPCCDAIHGPGCCRFDNSGQYPTRAHASVDRLPKSQLFDACRPSAGLKHAGVTPRIEEEAEFLPFQCLCAAFAAVRSQ
jgi:hypothetical protein